MTSLLRLATLLVFTILFAVVVLPAGLLLRWRFDPLGLRWNPRATSYFRMRACPHLQTPPAAQTGTGGFASPNS